MSLLIMFNEVVEKLKAIEKDDGKPQFCTVGLWNSQILNEAIEQADNFPACYIEFSNIQWSTEPNPGGYNTQITEEQKGLPSVVTIHICHSHLKDETESFPIIHPINEKVYFALQNQENEEDYGPMIRTTERQDTNHNRMIDWQMDFQVEINQTGQDINRKEIPADTLDQEFEEQ